ncbi:hypothetical protein RE628_07535 [Paenibacillus sp. D2_2]|nr:hypothetical protein [Paenibacillus sp. D2_2]WMT42247.1 hypothetical protein RE628_07535 [Paenibacillus sp. D2_2]
MGDAINALTAVAALIGSKRISVEPATEDELQNKQFDNKMWDWMLQEDRRQMAKQRGTGRVSSTEKDTTEEGDGAHE